MAKVIELWPAPRIPRGRVLSFGEMLVMVCTVGAFMWGAIYLLWRWICS